MHLMKAGFFALALSVVASPTMAVDFSRPILDVDGKPSEKCDDPVKHTGCSVYTLGRLSADALLNDLPQDHDPRTGQSTLSGEQKATNAALALRVVAAKGDIKLSVEDLAALKARIGIAGTPLAVLRAWSMLDPNTKLDASK